VANELNLYRKRKHGNSVGCVRFLRVDTSSALAAGNKKHKGERSMKVYCSIHIEEELSVSYHEEEDKWLVEPCDMCRHETVEECETRYIWKKPE